MFGGERKTTLTATAAKKEWRVAHGLGGQEADSSQNHLEKSETEVKMRRGNWTKSGTKGVQ